MKQGDVTNWRKLAFWLQLGVYRHRIISRDIATVLKNRERRIGQRRFNLARLLSEFYDLLLGREVPPGIGIHGDRVFWPSGGHESVRPISAPTPAFKNCGGFPVPPELDFPQPGVHVHRWYYPGMDSGFPIAFLLTGEICETCGATREYLGPALGYRVTESPRSQSEALTDFDTTWQAPREVVQRISEPQKTAVERTDPLSSTTPPEAKP